AIVSTGRPLVSRNFGAAPSTSRPFVVGLRLVFAFRLVLAFARILAVNLATVVVVVVAALPLGRRSLHLLGVFARLLGELRLLQLVVAGRHVLVDLRQILRLGLAQDGAVQLEDRRDLLPGAGQRA